LAQACFLSMYHVSGSTKNSSMSMMMGWRCRLVAVSCLLVAGAAHTDAQFRGATVGKASSGQAVLQNEGTDHDHADHAHAAASELVQTTAELSAGTRLKAKLHTWLRPLSAAAVLTTIALQMSPLPSSLEIKRERDVKRYDGYPYFSVLAGATQWCIYGSYAAYTSKDMNFLTMVAANGPGVLLGSFYITNFFRYVPVEDGRNAALKRYLTIGATLVLGEVACCVVYGAGAVFWLGLLGSIGSAQIAISPFKTLPEVLRTRSTRSWPLDLCMWNLIQSWFTGGFGLANNDIWVWMPNLIGVIAAIIQLSLVTMFWERKFGPRGVSVKLKASAALA